jgi:uncharacterized protein (DUF305 family)
MRTSLWIAATVAAAPVSTTRPGANGFADQLDRAMETMHQGMASAPRTGDPDHDFVTGMIPHHQGAIDMARALLLYGKDPSLRRLAEGIIADQQTEIALMRRWLAQHPSTEEHR